MGDFLAIVKEKNFIEVVSRSINQVRYHCQNIFRLFLKVIIITVNFKVIIITVVFKG